MFALTVTLVAALTAAQAQDPRDSRPPQTDQTVAVSRGARLLVENHAGEVNVRVWERDALRVQARHATRSRIHVATVPSGVRVYSSTERGPRGSIDYEISAPAWMPIRVDGQFTFVTIDGTQAEVTVDTVHGDVTVRGGNGVTAKSVEGNIKVEGAKGTINVNSVNEGVAIDRASGEIVAETVNGPIVMSRMDATRVEAGSINGNISYEGMASDAGRYRLTSHNGNIIVGVPESSNATFAVRTYNGGFQSDLPAKGNDDRKVGRGRRVLFTLGSGNADFELESFSGSIRLRKPGTMPEQKIKGKDQ